MQTVMECGQWTLRRRVLPQHTDHAGVMWHGAYLAWLEEARVEALNAAGLAYSELSARGLELPVVDLSIQYIRPLLHGEAVELISRVDSHRGLRLNWLSDFVGADRRLAARARVELVLVERALGEPVFRLRRRWPADLSSALINLAGG